MHPTLFAATRRTAFACAITVLAVSALRPAAASTFGPQLTLLGTAAPTSLVAFDVLLPLRNKADLAALLQAQENPASSSFHQWLQPSDFASRFGPSAATEFVVASALRAAGLQVVTGTRSLHVTGTTTAVNALFGTQLALAEGLGGTVRPVFNGAWNMPPALNAVGAVVSAFSASGIEALPMIRNGAHGYIRNGAHGYGTNAASTTPPGGLFYNDLKQAYGFPSYAATITRNGTAERLDGTGTTIAVLMASDVQDTDVATLFNHTGFAASSGTGANPAVWSRRPVNGGAVFNAASAASEEATVDVEQVLGGAPGAHLILYDTPDLSDGSLTSALVAIDNDDTADVVSASFGQCELYYTAAYNNGADQTAQLQSYSELFQQGNAEGITFVAASGDGAGLGCLNTAYFNGGSGQFIAGVSVPAADPDVTAVGGTNLVATGANTTGGTSWTENAWSDPELPYDPLGFGTSVSGGLWGAGGGISTLYGEPSWQTASVPSSTGRAVPDIAMAMGGCPDIAADTPCDGGNLAINGAGNTARSFLNIVFNGAWDPAIGTSTSAPLFATAVALMVEANGRQGNLNPTLYALANGAPAPFHAGVPGWNGVTTNGNGWSATAGLGTPDVVSLAGIGGTARAGTPGTASNP